MWYTRLEINSHAHISLGELEMHDRPLNELTY